MSSFFDLLGTLLICAGAIAVGFLLALLMGSLFPRGRIR